MNSDSGSTLSEILPILKEEQDARTELISHNISLNDDAVLLKSIFMSKNKNTGRNVQLERAKAAVERLERQKKMSKYLTTCLLSFDLTIDVDLLQSLNIFQCTASRSTTIFEMSRDVLSLMVSDIYREYEEVISLRNRRKGDYECALAGDEIQAAPSCYRCSLCYRAAFFSSQQVIDHIYDEHHMIPLPTHTVPPLLL